MQHISQSDVTILGLNTPLIWHNLLLGTLSPIVVSTYALFMVSVMCTVPKNPVLVHLHVCLDMKSTIYPPRLAKHRCMWHAARDMQESLIVCSQQRQM